MRKFSCLDEIRIRLLEPTDVGRLFYQPDPETEPALTHIQNRLDFQRVCIININSTIIIDLGQNRIIRFVELNIPQKFWKQNMDFILPEPSRAADIQVVGRMRKYAFLEKPAWAITGEELRYVFLSCGEPTAGGIWVALSDQCLALIQEDCLRGFFVWLKSRSN